MRIILAAMLFCLSLGAQAKERVITKEQLKLTTFKDLAKPTIIEQLEIEFPDDG